MKHNKEEIIRLLKEEDDVKSGIGISEGEHICESCGSSSFKIFYSSQSPFDMAISVIKAEHPFLFEEPGLEEYINGIRNLKKTKGNNQQRQYGERMCNKCGRREKFIEMD
jgi:hypothetical protein